MKPCTKCKINPRRKSHTWCGKCGNEYLKKFRSSRPKWEGSLVSRLKVSKMMKHIKELIVRGQLNAAIDTLGLNIQEIQRVKNVPNKAKYLIIPSDK